LIEHLPAARREQLAEASGITLFSQLVAGSIRHRGTPDGDAAAWSGLLRGDGRGSGDGKERAEKRGTRPASGRCHVVDLSGHIMGHDSCSLQRHIGGDRMWNKDEMHGKIDQLKGRAKQAAGDLTDDENLKDEGAVDEAAGDVQEAFGKGRRKVGEAIEDIGDKIKR
jgi:uncharacterized protein YjbJ (UPF0337 family)